jgi:hypothetical protein
MPRRPRPAKLALIIAAAVLLSTIPFYLALVRIPNWYKITYISPERHQTVRDDLEAAFNALNLPMQASQPFQYVLHQDRLNNWIAARHQIWPRLERYLPPQLEHPAVAFRNDRVLLAAVVRPAGLRAVVSVALSVHPEPRRVTVRLESCRVGALPLPRWLLRRLLASLTTLVPPLPPEAPTALLDGLAFPNRFDWPSGGRTFRIQKIQFQSDCVVATILPGPGRQTGPARR